jgi:hypothetical protein
MIRTLLASVAAILSSGLCIAGTLQATFEQAPDAFPLVVNGAAAGIWIDPSDLQPTDIAAHLLADDIHRVTGKSPRILTDPAQLGRTAVLIGTLGHSRVIDSLAASGALNIGNLHGQWEAYRLQQLDHPLPNVDRALLIIGSDRRGTAYGVTTLSRKIGVSPWYWWANVPTPHHDEIYLTADDYTDGPPGVKYRGIFLNDEAPAMSGWAKEQFGGFNSKMYVHVFELLLRLKANYLWPAMWGEAFNEDDAQNPKLANDYGIFMGTSHQEPMMRAQAEWDRRHNGADWNFAKDPDGMQQFWRDGIHRNRAYDNLITLGMRGRNDTPMIENATIEQSIDLLQKIVAAQRKIIADEINPDVSQVPQMWCLYKEVQSYYEHGLRVPDDVTLLWSDDNWGNLRRLPTDSERNRAGGAGIYYHFDYVGDPRNYKWINTNPIAKVWEQMSLADAYGANRIWIVNVGDLKPMEFPIDFFMTMAWNPAAMTLDRLNHFTRDWAAEQLGNEHADEIADLLSWYTRMNGRRKPELLTAMPYSIENYHEADTILDQCKSKSAAADALAAKLPAELQDAFFQLVQHPVKATAIVNELYIQTARNHLYATQRRASTNAIADKVEHLFREDAALSDHYNHAIAGGFWNHMMDQTHIGYTNWQQPDANILPHLERLHPDQPASMGIAAEGNSDTLPAFDSLNRQTRTIDLFNRGRTPFTYTAAAGAPWVVIDNPTGAIDTDLQLHISIDRTKLPAGTSPQSTTITIHGANATQAITIHALHLPTPTRDTLVGHAENARVVSILASHYTTLIPTPVATWTEIPDLGQTGPAMRASPSTAPSILPPAPAPELQYRFFTTTAVRPTITTYVSPTQPFVPGRALRYAICIDDNPPQLIDTLADPSHNAWQNSVSDNIRRCQSNHPFLSPGYHTIHLFMIDPALIIQRLVINLGGELPSYLGPPETWRGKPRANGT